MPEYLVIPSIVVGVIVVLGLAFWARYKTVSPDEAMIVTGSFLGSKTYRRMNPAAKSKSFAAAVLLSFPYFSVPNLYRSYLINWM